MGSSTSKQQTPLLGPAPGAACLPPVLPSASDAAVFAPNFAIENVVVLHGVNLADARAKLLLAAPQHNASAAAAAATSSSTAPDASGATAGEHPCVRAAKAVIALSPLSVEEDIHSVARLWWEDPKGPAGDVIRIRFLERVPVCCCTSCCLVDVELDAAHVMAKEEQQQQNVLFYESKSNSNIWVRKRRQLQVQDGTGIVSVSERIEGMCAGYLRGIVVSAADKAHKEHMGLYQTLFK
jgi:hypothetical protein